VALVALAVWLDAFGRFQDASSELAERNLNGLVALLVVAPVGSAVYALRRYHDGMQARRTLARLTLHDGLTGLPNRRFLGDSFAAMLADERRDCLGNVAVLCHETGDQALRQVASILSKAARSEDVICRLGGEEFLVISPDTLAPAAMRLADRLRQSVCNAPITLGTLRHTLSISIGVAQLGPAMVSFDQLLKAADDVLYHAKRLGGNRVKSPGMGVSERPAGLDS